MMRKDQAILSEGKKKENLAELEETEQS